MCQAQVCSFLWCRPSVCYQRGWHILPLSPQTSEQTGSAWLMFPGSILRWYSCYARMESRNSFQVSFIETPLLSFNVYSAAVSLFSSSLPAWIDFCKRSPKKFLEITEAEFLQANYRFRPGTKLHSLCLIHNYDFLNILWENQLAALALTDKIGGSQTRGVTETLSDWIRTAFGDTYGQMLCWWRELQLIAKVSFWHGTEDRNHQQWLLLWKHSTTYLLSIPLLCDVWFIEQ